MKIGSLFAGYGGLDLAVEAALPGAQTVWVSDIEPGPRKILDHRFPDAPNLGDITQVDWSQVEPVDVLIGGSPCQDLSMAGRRRGMLPGTRSGLWESMLNAIKALQPRLVVWENVRGALSAKAFSLMEPEQGRLGDPPRPALRAVGRVLGDLAGVGYDAQWGVIRASTVGAPHRRERIFIVAHPANPGRLRGEPGRLPTPPEAASRGTLGDVSGRDGAPVTLLRTPMADEAAGGPLHPDVAKARRPTLRLTGQILALTGDLKKEASHAHLQNQTDTSSTLPRLRGLDGAEAIQRTAGGLRAVHGPQDLRDGMRQQQGLSSGEHAPLESAAGSEADRVRAVRGDRETPCPSQGQGRDQQRSGEPHDSLRELPPEVALGAGPGRADGVDFGPYEAAIQRWEQVLGREAPPPTEPGRTGRPQLSPRFCEWMMGLPAGWVTDVPDLSRAQQLRALGNGVVPQQGAAAIQALLNTAAQEIAA